MAKFLVTLHETVSYEAAFEAADQHDACRRAHELWDGCDAPGREKNFSITRHGIEVEEWKEIEAPVMNDRPTCSRCGSTSIKADCHAIWMPETRTWEIDNVFEKGAYCASCDGKTSIKWLEGRADDVALAPRLREAFYAGYACGQDGDDRPFTEQAEEAWLDEIDALCEKLNR